MARAGLSQRAQHRPQSLELLHGSLFDLQCDSFSCDYTEYGNFADPLVPALEIPRKANGTEYDLSDADVPMRDIETAALPRCPQCRASILRPGVVWFGETLPPATLRRVSEWMDDRAGIDLVLVIGTSATVWPAAGYIEKARRRGARLAVINIEEPPVGVASALGDGDWFFQGDAKEVVPRILAPVIGERLEGAGLVQQ
ncbi:hypothetical protein MRB53_040549 [Persea americana]|nr:hypothetical protein MRB53_040549 [Persea americana]